jgi:uncharacterized protein YjiS (DUF1127 family)
MEMIMSTISRAARRDNVAGSILTLGTALRNGWVAYTTWRLHQLAISQLRGMSDRELKDIGVRRSQIEAAVRGNIARDHALIRHF